MAQMTAKTSPRRRCTIVSPRSAPTPTAMPGQPVGPGGPCSRLCAGGAGAKAKRKARGHPRAGSGERDPPGPIARRIKHAATNSARLVVVADHEIHARLLGPLYQSARVAGRLAAETDQRHRVSIQTVRLTKESTPSMHVATELNLASNVDHVSVTSGQVKRDPRIAAHGHPDPVIVRKSDRLILRSQTLRARRRTNAMAARPLASRMYVLGSGITVVGTPLKPPLPKSAPLRQSFEIVLLSMVTAASSAIARPQTMLAAVTKVMLRSAMMFPWKAVVLPSVAEVPTRKKMPAPAPPLTVLIDEPLAVVSVEPI